MWTLCVWGCVCVGLLDHHRSVVIEPAHGVCAGWQEHNRNLWGFPQHHIAFESTPSPASYKKIDNKIYIFSAVYWLQRVSVSESNAIEAEQLFIPKVGVNVIPGDVWLEHWRVSIGLGISTATENLLLCDTPSFGMPYCEWYLDLSP